MQGRHWETVTSTDETTTGDKMRWSDYNDSGGDGHSPPYTPLTSCRQRTAPLDDPHPEGSTILHMRRPVTPQSPIQPRLESRPSGLRAQGFPGSQHLVGEAKQVEEEEPL